MGGQFNWRNSSVLFPLQRVLNPTGSRQEVQQLHTTLGGVSARGTGPTELCIAAFWLLIL
jgi:hypothetical protein